MPTTRTPLALALALGLVASALPAAPRPDIVFVLTDDMGTADVSCYGAPDIVTPHIDRLAADGVRFTQAYAMGAECTPSRASILTGRYPQRAGGLECAIGTGDVGRYDDAIRLAEAGELGLPAEQAVLAPALKAAGYTTAVFGKWHLGYGEKFHPQEQGFDQFAGCLGGNVDYFTHRELSDLDVYLVGREPAEREGYMTHLILEDSLRFIREADRDDRPYFLFVALTSPHFPFQAPGDEDVAFAPDMKAWTSGTREKYLEMMRDIDGAVCALADEVAEDTLFVFASDHGGFPPALNTPLRDQKGSLFEGGIRVPLIARWPGVIKPGTVSGQVGSLMDLTVSFLAAAGTGAPADRPGDGIDLLGHVASGADDHDRTLFWTAKRGDRVWEAVRHGDRKWLAKREGDTYQEWCFDLAADPSEKNDLGTSDPSPAPALRERLAAWKAEVTPER